MESRILCYHNDEKKAMICNVGKVIDEKTGEIVWDRQFEIPDGHFSRFEVDIKGWIQCSKYGDELGCSAYHNSGFLPEMAYKDKDGKEYKNYDFIREKPDEFISFVLDLAEFEKIRPDLVKMLKEEGIKVIYDDETPYNGWAACGRHKIAVSPKSPHPVETLAHEVAHCKEQILRKRKNLPPMKAEWKEEDKKIIPVGGEKRAVNFQNRIKKRYWLVKDR